MFSICEYASGFMLFDKVLATNEASFNSLLIATKVSERNESAVKNLASCGNTPPFIKMDSTAKGSVLVST